MRSFYDDVLVATFRTAQRAKPEIDFSELRRD